MRVFVLLHEVPEALERVVCLEVLDQEGDNTYKRHEFCGDFLGSVEAEVFVSDDVLDDVQDGGAAEGYQGELQRLTAQTYLNHLINLSLNEAAYAQTKALALQELKKIANWAKSKGSSSEEERAHLSFMAQTIDQFLKKSNPRKINTMLTPPPGSPIGSCDFLH